MSSWTDIEMVEAVCRHDNRALERYYRDCKHYFVSHAGALFMSDTVIDDIFQESMIHLWREIETHRIEVRDGVLCRWSEGEPRPMTSTLRTFLMAVAKRKHWEQLRRQSALLLTDDDNVLEHSRYGELFVADSPDEQRERIVADAVLAMSDRCRQILTLFYYEHRTLVEILELRSENTSKVGLKTSKYKCMQRLRQTLTELFRRQHISI